MAPPPPLPPSVVELDGPFEHRFLHTRGLRLHAVVAGSDTDPLVLLIHDSFGGWFDYREVIAPLAEQGYFVAALDLRGYGMSDKPPIQQISLARLISSDLAGAIRALGHTRAAVVGADVGGSIAWLMATLYPELVSGLVSVSAAHPVDMRRAAAARPWDYTRILARGLTSRFPVALAGAASAARLDRIQEKYLRANTSAHFQRSARFDDALHLRQQAARIGNTRPATAATTRLQLEILPAKALAEPVAANTLLIHPPQTLWRQLNRRSEQRVEGQLRKASVPGAKNMPHVEAPARFVEVVSSHITEWH